MLRVFLWPPRWLHADHRDWPFAQCSHTARHLCQLLLSAMALRGGSSLRVPAPQTWGPASQPSSCPLTQHVQLTLCPSRLASMVCVLVGRLAVRDTGLLKTNVL